jgi:hypothetical protein
MVLICQWLALTRDETDVIIGNRGLKMKTLKLKQCLTETECLIANIINKYSDGDGDGDGYSYMWTFLVTLHFLYKIHLQCFLETLLDNEQMEEQKLILNDESREVMKKNVQTAIDFLERFQEVICSHK